MTLSNSKAIYLQIADKIMDGILAGEQSAGERIPSVREYASTVEVNANTVMRTYDHLQQLGVIFNRRGVGFFVAENAPATILSARRASFFNEECPYIFSRMRQFGITPQELAEMYTNFLNTEK